MSKGQGKQKQVVFDADEASVVCEELERCREVLLIGLASYGELGRLSEVQSNYASELKAPDEDGVMRPINQESHGQIRGYRLGNGLYLRAGIEVPRYSDAQNARSRRTS